MFCCRYEAYVGTIFEYLFEDTKSNIFQDLVENESLRLDWTFRYSIINDIVEVSIHFLKQQTKQ